MEDLSYFQQKPYMDKDLRKVDSFKPDIVIIEGVKNDGIGLAIMNRLIRACEYHYIKI